MQPIDAEQITILRHPRFRLAILALLFAVACPMYAAGQSAENAAATQAQATAIVERMMEQNAVRAEHLKYFTSERHYHIEFHGMGRTLSAELNAEVTYNAGSGKTFRVIDESGSHVLLNHVLLKLLETERDDSRRQVPMLTSQNYDFAYQSSTTENGRPAYIFSVAPKVKNKLFYRGRIWIDAADCAVVRVEAEPAENPSFWIKSTEIHHSYEKIGEFWLPQLNKSESKVRFGGNALLTIDYGKYQMEKPVGTVSSGL